MTLDEAKTRLANVQAAMDKIIAAAGVSEYGVNGRSVKRDLTFLERERDRLELIVAQLESGSFGVARFKDAQ